MRPLEQMRDEATVNYLSARADIEQFKPSYQEAAEAFERGEFRTPEARSLGRRMDIADEAEQRADEAKLRIAEIDDHQAKLEQREDRRRADLSPTEWLGNIALSGLVELPQPSFDGILSLLPLRVEKEDRLLDLQNPSLHEIKPIAESPYSLDKAARPKDDPLPMFIKKIEPIIEEGPAFDGEWIFVSGMGRVRKDAYLRGEYIKREPRSTNRKLFDSILDQSNSDSDRW